MEKITTKEYEHLLKTLRKKSLNLNKEDPTWIKAFQIHGEETGHKLGMLCGGCYFKVLGFLKKKLNK